MGIARRDFGKLAGGAVAGTLMFPAIPAFGYRNGHPAAAAKPKSTSYYAGKKSLTVAREMECGDTRWVQLRTDVPKKGFWMDCNVFVDSRGMRSFVASVAWKDEFFECEGKTDSRGVLLELKKGGKTYSQRFAASSYDVTTLELMICDESDIAQLKTGDVIRILDPIEQEIYEARITAEFLGEGEVTARRVTFDVNGEIHQVVFDRRTGECLLGVSDAEAWKRVSSADAEKHLRLLRT